MAIVSVVRSKYGIKGAGKTPEVLAKTGDRGVRCWICGRLGQTMMAKAKGAMSIPAQGLRRATDEYWMDIALREARAAADEGEVPIGATVVHNGELVARAHNRRELDCDPAAHAEFLAIEKAAQTLGRWRLSGCTVYVTVEPCLMCAGLMVNARIERCVYGAPDPKGGALGTLYDVSCDARLNHEFEVSSGVRAREAADLLRAFFKARR